jgi:maleate cis-trans isomerase
MSGWKARIGYLSPSVFETPSDWDLILPAGFTIVSSGLNVQAHTEAEFNKAIDALGAGLDIFKAEECDAILMGGITLGTQRGYAAEQEVVRKLSHQVGLPVSTAMNATVEALKYLKVKNNRHCDSLQGIHQSGGEKILRRRRRQSPRHQRLGSFQARRPGQTTGLLVI